MFQEKLEEFLQRIILEYINLLKIVERIIFWLSLALHLWVQLDIVFHTNN